MGNAILVVAGLMLGDVASDQQHRLVCEGADVLPEVNISGQPAIIHTQGLYVTDNHYLVTGRWESEPKRALLLRFSRNDLRAYEYIDITPPAIDGVTLDHPGGFDVDSKGRLWIPLSTSYATGTSLICRFRIEPNKPLTPREPEFFFRVNDHIGAICRTKDDSLVGANWDTKRVYLWSAEGTMRTSIDRNNLFAEAPKWQLAVQDWKFTQRNNRPFIIAGGIDKSNDSATATIQLIDFVSREIRESYRFPKRDDVSRPITNEGLALHESRLYLLPEDIGRGAKVLRFKFISTLGRNRAK